MGPKIGIPSSNPPPKNLGLIPGLPGRLVGWICLTGGLGSGLLGGLTIIGGL